MTLLAIVLVRIVRKTGLVRLMGVCLILYLFQLLILPHCFLMQEWLQRTFELLLILVLSTFVDPNSLLVSTCQFRGDPGLGRLPTHSPLNGLCTHSTTGR